MRRFITLSAGLALVCALAMGIIGEASAAPVNHGIGFTKGCDSPTHIGAAYSCTWTVRNVVDEAEDTLTFTGLDRKSVV